MESSDVVKAKKIISYITLGIYISFMILSSAFMIIFWIICFFSNDGNIMTKDAMWLQTMDIILVDTVVLYSIPIISCIVQFFTNRIYFFIQVGIIVFHWLLMNGVVLYITASEIAFY